MGPQNSVKRGTTGHSITKVNPISSLARCDNLDNGSIFAARPYIGGMRLALTLGLASSALLDAQNG